ncbi:MAG TPA: type II toxin-antitoxin system antitoxin SocA domain-containing protein [Candidatus Baltobacteraceae bacterium]|jgi:uncharacterized phage-associated protein|nr:type II toxin-antitoxin system antitoxin SocA domain-containing protein [Candidatus Baltobacteraceae bacterium]
MASVVDVAQYVLKKLGSIPAMKLQKLVYYSQAWSLVWDERPLFNNRIEAWANGPVAPDLYERHRGEYRVNDVGGEAECIDSLGEETIDTVLSYYGEKSSQWLSDLTHMEAPWRDARSGLAPGVASNVVITHAAMAEYYGSLT